MKTETIAVLDVGKTNTKIVLFDASLAVVEVHQEASRTDGTHLDTQWSWQFARAKLADIASRYALTAVVPTTHGATFAILRDGQLAQPVIDYEKRIPAALFAEYDAIRPPFAETFSPNLPLGLNAGRQLFALSRSGADVLRPADRLIPYAQYWAWMLSGEAVSEVSSLGCHTDLWSPLQARPSSLCTAMGWGELLPALAPAWGVLGAPLPALGLPSSCRILVGAHDSNAAFLRYLAGARAPFAVVSTGTWFICFNTAGDVAALDPTRDTLANVDIMSRPVASARFMGGRDYAGIAGETGLQANAQVADLRAVVSAGLICLPVTPQDRSSHRSYDVSGPPGSAAERQALGVLTCALMTAETLALTGPVEQVYVDGPFAGNKLYLAALAALLGDACVLASEVPHGTSVGAALLAQWPQAGGLPDYRLAARPIAPVEVDLEPYRRRWRSRLAERQALRD